MSKQIISKYFCSKVMDESLNDFQEKKTKCSGPKLNYKSQPRPKPKKRVKGQKDIRTLIQSKKNELINFTEDFNKVCSKNGIDVDSQELQLAIALSKSLQEEGQVEPGTSQANKSLTSQERSNQIRRTLQEYGFKVPETKIKSDANKRVKKCKKLYKLLLISEAERLQKISNKYSQILFENPDPGDFYESNNNINKGLYYLGTNISYLSMRNNDLFHITDILQDISVSKGSLLRNWCDIPGRPCSPVLLKDLSFSISDIDCTQAELDTILSGTLIATKAIFNSKITINCTLEKTNSEVITEPKQCNNETKDITCILINPENEETVNEDSNICEDKEFTFKEHTLTTMPSSPCENRSLSPDIFGDDASSLIENSIVDTHHNVENPAQFNKTNNGQIIDLCKPTSITNINLTEPTSSFFETNNFTKRKSDDFMDLTECVQTSSQKYKSNSLSLSTRANGGEKICNDDCMEITECINPYSQKSNVITNENVNKISDDASSTEFEIKDNYPSCKYPTTFDLTQSSNSDEELPMVEICGTQNSLSCDTIIVDYDHFANVSNNDRVIELDKESNTNKDVGFVEENNAELSTQSIKMHLSINNEKDILVQDEIVNKNVSNNHTNLSDIDLTQSSGSSVDIHQSYNFDQPEIELNKEPNTNKDVAFVKENNAELSTQSIKTHLPINNEKDTLVQDEKVNKNISNNHTNLSDIDLTQSSGSSVDIHQSNNSDQPETFPIVNYNNLGKIGDVSIDYDEICVGTASSECFADEQFDNIQTKYTQNSSNVLALSKNSTKISQTDQISNCSSTSKVFELSDKELNYSVCKSNIENFKLGGISIMDDLSNLSSSKCTSNRTKCALNRSLSDSCLPSVSFRDKERIVNSDRQTEKYIKLNNESIYSTPIKAVIKDDKISVKTPTNSDYVIKVREVTPMLDYAGMSSPERNKELEKYGLKPFKRKRAIQLLTHLYNQTHPIIEYCSEEPIPAKKLKLDSPKKINCPIKRKNSPRKNRLTQSATTGLDKGNEIFYEESKDVPDIKDIECSPDDWVFQKREKAKVHSCRVPLHIAFHNYVSCRRGLRQAILRYEPVNIEVIHKDLVSYGYRYNPKDLLKFLDKKCITVKTADSNSRNCRK